MSMKKYGWKFKVTKLRNKQSQYGAQILYNNEPVNAIYIDTGTQDRLNPFIAALPPAKNNEADLIRNYTKGLIGYDYKNVPLMSNSEKIMAVNELKTKFRVCLSFQKQLEDVFHSSLINSYRLRYLQRDINTYITVQLQNKEKHIHQKLWGDSADAANSSFALLGYSGVGKSTSLKQLLSTYPQVIIHKLPDGDELPQIVYLAVNCIPNSNFNQLYISIGKAIDRALGNITPFYETIIERKRNLSQKMEKVIELIETFSIGIILLDEIQLIDFKHTRENSFEGLMTIVNSTKVAITVIGTEDSYFKMFSNLRNARRVGTLINANNYIENKLYFKNLVEYLMHYQWFDSWVECSDELVATFKDCSYGIIDQLINLYVMMHIHYFQIQGNKPIIDSDYIKMIGNKYFPYMKNLTDTLKYDSSPEILIDALKESKDKLNELLDKSLQESNKLTIIEDKNKKLLAYEEDLENKVITNIMSVVDIEEGKIDKAFKDVLSEVKNYMDYNLEDITKMVSNNLFRKKRKSKNKKPTQEEMIKALMEQAP